MNLQIHRVERHHGCQWVGHLDAILAGDRDPLSLAELCNIRVKSPRETVAQALVGDYRPEHLFTLKQSLDGYRYYQKLISELDDEIARLMHTLPDATEHLLPMPTRTKRGPYQRMGNDPSFNLRSELYRIAGVDLTDIPGVSAIAAQVILTEVGPDVSRFRNASAFASWMGLCPDKRISGGKVLSTKTRKVKNRVAIVLRLGAKSLSRAKDYFGSFFRRMRARLGTTQAITATAHKLTRHLPCPARRALQAVFHQCDEQEQQRAEMRLQTCRKLGFQLIPVSTGNPTTS